MIRLIARLWVKFKKWRNRPHFPVYPHKGYYAAWKDKHPPRQDSWARIFGIIIAIMLLLGVPCLGFTGYSAYRASQRPSIVYITAEESTAEFTDETTEEPAIEITVEATEESTAEFTAETVVDMLPTATLTPMSIRRVGETTPTLTPMQIGATPTLLPPMLQTLQYLRQRETVIALTPTQPRPSATATQRIQQVVVTRVIIVTVIAPGAPADNGGYLTPYELAPFPTALPTYPPMETPFEITDEPTPDLTDELTPELTDELTPELTEEFTPTASPTFTETVTWTPTFTPTWTATATPTATATIGD